MDRQPAPRNGMPAPRPRAPTLEEQVKYAGQHIAWSWDGREILMGAPTLEELDAKLEHAGIAVSEVVHSYVDDGVSAFIPDLTYSDP